MALAVAKLTYMSPEQAAGKAVDKRTDLWAFGVVLLEMLTGRQTFAGETVSHVLAAVLKDQPDWAAPPPHTPESIRKWLRRCLEKDRKRRLADAADVAAHTADGESFRAEKPRLWSEGRHVVRGSRMFDLHPDGTRIAMAIAQEGPTEKQDKLTFLLNFFDELRRIAPVSKQ